ncbi:ATP-binding protein [Phenylobacterium sp.]|uniref:ATP-binding protein n=1 Tax=Phenylobacterium sp. TaxID=1871053 RepID=UPI0025EEA4E4|nr:ATP-binding protein [Phenylobacterium sp.]
MSQGLGGDGAPVAKGRGARGTAPGAARPPRPLRRAVDRRRRRAETERAAELEVRRQADILVHDFNNLLNVILAANEALAAGLPEGSDAYELARVSQAAAEKGAELLRRMAELARPVEDAPAAAVDAAEVSVAVARLAQVSTAAMVTVVAMAQPESMACHADGADLESALLNLCVNAGHAMPDGGVVRIATTPRKLGGDEAAALGVTPGAYVAFSVVDNGVGMSPEVLARAAEPYFTTRAGRGGTGLGLAGVRDFARRSGGALRLVSELGRGSTATLYLPRA